MSKNVLIISGSPRRGGNSETLCDQFAAGAKDAGNHVEKIVLQDKKSVTAPVVMPVRRMEYAYRRTTWPN